MASQTTSALLTLRELVLSGELQPGERLLEISVAERLKMSRTPVRTALAKLAGEGLLTALPTAGYVVRRFTEADVHEAIEMRGALEGLAARFAAERAPDRQKIAALHAMLDEIDRLFSGPQIAPAAFERYVDLNAAFHAGLLALADSPALSEQLGRVYALPFASPSGFVMAQAETPQALRILVVAEDQHRCVLEAIETRDGARAEAIMREHARLARRNLDNAAEDQRAWDQVAGAALIDRRGRQA
jgi:GntR family transcriptional regulator of vanillate catabolism